MSQKILAADQYWKFRALQRDIDAYRVDAQKQLDAMKSKLDAVMRENGLDPAVAYLLNDDDCSAKPQAPPPAVAPA
jgi:hypothetical protein